MVPFKSDVSTFSSTFNILETIQDGRVVTRYNSDIYGPFNYAIVSDLYRPSRLFRRLLSHTRRSNEWWHCCWPWVTFELKRFHCLCLKNVRSQLQRLDVIMSDYIYCRIRLEGCWARLVSDGWVSCCSRRWRVCWSQVQSPVSAVHTQTSRLLVCLSYWRLRLQNDTQHWWAHLSSCQRSTLRPCYSLIAFLSWRWLSHVDLN